MARGIRSFQAGCRHSYRISIYRCRNAPKFQHYQFVGSAGNTWRIKDILSPSVSAGADGLITPSIYSSKLLPMPASLARYATIYYASSLVRYRPSIFDAQSAPENAYLFDAIARECALPILVDALTGLEGRAQMFYGDESLRR